MGRRRIDIKPLNSERDRYQTFCRRRSGFLKKGQELSVLCDVSIVVMVQVKGSGACAFYSSNHPQDIDCPGWEDKVISSVLKARKQGTLIDSRKFSDCIPIDSDEKSGPICVTLTKKSPGAFAGCVESNAKQKGKRKPEILSTPRQGSMDHPRLKFILPVMTESSSHNFPTMMTEDSKSALDTTYLCNYTVMKELHETFHDCQFSEEIVPRHMLAADMMSVDGPFQSQWEEGVIGIEA